MKKILSVWTTVFIVVTGWAQSPEKMSYQAVIRDADSDLVINQSVSMKISILQGAADGAPVYVETHTAETNANGLVTLEIGTGTTDNDFSAIDWSDGPYFINTETDPSGGTDYTITGTSQLLSVPYALYAKRAESVTDIRIPLSVSSMGDTLFLGSDKWIIIPGISQAKTGIKDTRDGNVYRTVPIGDQVWMAENLKYLPSVIGQEHGGSVSTPPCYVYGYYGTDLNEAKATLNYSTYGVLYSWAAAMNGAGSSSSNPSGVQGVCPDGWHLPSDEEWTELENYLADNGYNYDGTTGGGRDKIAKAMASASGWNSSSNTGAVGNADYPAYINKSGFTALPGGCRYPGSFSHIGNYGSWWSTKMIFPPWAVARALDHEFIGIQRKEEDYRDMGFSVRCVKD